MSQVVEQLILWLGSFSYWGVGGLLLLCGVGIPMPEEPILITAGYMVHLGLIELWPTIVICMLAIVGGDAIAFGVGRTFGREKAFLGMVKRVMSLRHLVRARRFLRNHGNRTIFLVRFLPGLRMPTYFMSGTLGVPFRAFLFYDTLAALISAPVSVLAAWYFGANIHAALQFTGGFHRYLLAGVLLVIAVWGFKTWQERYIRRASLIAGGG